KGLKDDLEAIVNFEKKSCPKGRLTDTAQSFYDAIQALIPKMMGAVRAKADGGATKSEIKEAKK
ncbi:unnamed protein product, partial [Prorocentrum cordatum]